MTVKPDTVKPDDVKNEDVKNEDTRWTSDAAKRAFASDNEFSDDTDDPHTPMTVHRETYTDGAGNARTRTYRVPTKDFPEFQQAREARAREM
jgi:hypothetical protein